MLVPLSWLREYVDVNLSPEALAEQLTLRGMEVQGITVSGADWTDVVVGRLLSVERHPNADKLWLTSVDVGGEAPLQIVCGADNISAGDLVPVAMVGAVLPGDRRIERSKIRGVESQGMLCSAIELGLGDDAEGIHLLGGAATSCRWGRRWDRSWARWCWTWTSSRTAATPCRWWAWRGRWPPSPAQRCACRMHRSRRMRRCRPPITCRSRSHDPAACPRFAARWLDDVQNGASPPWMQQRLLAAGMRPISAVVDVTNYVMHELGQPMHAYDADTVPDGRIVVRRARAGETLETIDHEQRRLDERMLVIADRERPIGLAGIMGGAGTEVTPATRRVILESAIFHGPTIRNTARRLALRSEASMRHEKGIGHELPRYAADRAVRLMAEITGARVASGIVDNDPEPAAPRVVEVDLGRVERLLGISLTSDEVGELLRPLGFAVERRRRRWP